MPRHRYHRAISLEESVSPTAQKFRVIGRRVPKVDAIDKVTGRAQFGADVLLPRKLVGKVLRSPHAHARIRSIDTSAAERLPGVVCVVTGEDIVANTEPIPGSWDPKEMGAKEVKWFASLPDGVKEAVRTKKPICLILAGQRPKGDC